VENLWAWCIIQEQNWPFHCRAQILTSVGLFSWFRQYPRRFLTDPALVVIVAGRSQGARWGKVKAVQVAYKMQTLPSSPLARWHYNPAFCCDFSFSSVLRIKLRALCMLERYSTTDLHPSPLAVPRLSSPAGSSSSKSDHPIILPHWEGATT
jgi:hypothetical protein